MVLSSRARLLSGSAGAVGTAFRSLTDCGVNGVWRSVRKEPNFRETFSARAEQW